MGSRSAKLLAAPVLLVVLLLTGCGSSASLGSSVQPRDGRAGLQVTGRLDGAQMALSDGAPRLETQDCDPMNGADADVCAIARDIGGQPFVLVFENPGVLESGATLAVGDPGCRPAACDEVTDVAVVDVQSGAGQRIRATGGQLELAQVDPSQRYVGTAQLRLPDGDLSISFDLVPRED